MKVRIVKGKSIKDFALENARSRSSFRLWLTFLKLADWNEPGDITKTFGSADLLGNGSDRVVFDIAGNNYRMICKYHFRRNWISFIHKVDRHTCGYSKLCDDNKQYTVNSY